MPLALSRYFGPRYHDWSRGQPTLNMGSDDPRPLVSNLRTYIWMIWKWNTGCFQFNFNKRKIATPTSCFLVQKWFVHVFIDETNMNCELWSRPRGTKKIRYRIIVTADILPIIYIFPLFYLQLICLNKKKNSIRSWKLRSLTDFTSRILFSENKR